MKVIEIVVNNKDFIIECNGKICEAIDFKKNGIAFGDSGDLEKNKIKGKFMIESYYKYNDEFPNNPYVEDFDK